MRAEGARADYAVVATSQDNWPVMTIEEIADVNPRVDKAAIPDDLPVSFVPMPAVGAADGSIRIGETRPAGEVKKGFTAFLEGDVLFAKITPCMENGKMAIVPKLVNGYGFGSTEFHVLRPKPGMDVKCPIPCDCIPIRSWPLFEARLLLPAFLSMLWQESKA